MRISVPSLRATVKLTRRIGLQPSACNSSYVQSKSKGISFLRKLGWGTWGRLRRCHYTPSRRDNIVNMRCRHTNRGQLLGTLFHTLGCRDWQQRDRLHDWVKRPDSHAFRPETRDVGLHGHQNVRAEKFWVNKIWKNSPSGKPICCWWLPVPGNGPDSSCRLCSYPRKMRNKEETPSGKQQKSFHECAVTLLQTKHFVTGTSFGRFASWSRHRPRSPVINFPFFVCECWRIFNKLKIEDVAQGRRALDRDYSPFEKPNC